MKFKTLFIINPISGGKQKTGLPSQVLKVLDLDKFAPEFAVTERVGHASVLAKEAIENGFDVIVGIGGDGTVNEIAAQLVGTEKVLGILPFGSGNGLGRGLQIPMNLEKAIKNLNRFDVSTIDVVRLNSRYFFNMAGVGFDAQISDAFKSSKKRGLLGYIKLCISEFNAFKPVEVNLTIDGVKLEKSAFLVSFANSSQYGNNVHISPESSLNDGLIEVVVVDPLNWIQLCKLGYAMVRKRVKDLKTVQIYTAKHIKVERSENGPMHLDGEPFNFDKDFEVNIVPRSLKVIVGPGFN